MVERLELFAECQAEKAEKLRTFRQYVMTSTL